MYMLCITYMQINTGTYKKIFQKFSYVQMFTAVLFSIVRQTVWLGM